MYFSRITFNPLVSHQQLAKTLCQDSYQEHRVLWQLFDLDPDAKRDFLYRQTIENGRVKYYVLSKRKPVDSSGIWLVDEPKMYDPKLTVGQKLFFSLRANPVTTVTNSDGKKVRHDVVMHEKKRISYNKLPKDQKPLLQELVQETCISWLQSRAESKGFALLSDTVRADGYRLHKSYTKQQKQPVQYSTVDFQGILTVADSDKFRNALFNGIGKSKAFGCGLLLVRRI